MTRSMPIIEARQKLTALPEELDKKPETGAVAVTRRGKPVLAIMSWDVYESIVETMEILSDEKMMSSLRQSVREIAAGKGISWKQAQKELGW